MRVNVEIVKVANGYAVLPPIDYNHNSLDWSKVYIFETYAKLTDKLQEILANAEMDRK